MSSPPALTVCGGLPPQLVISSLRAGYGNSWALKIPELRLGSEPMCGIIGPNGSGKSTLLKVAAGLLAPETGTVRFHGTEIQQFRRWQLARKIGYLPQECPLLFDYGVGEVVAMGRYAHEGRPDSTPEKNRRAVARALQETGLAELRGRRLSQLSGGERRRAWVAAALAQEPEMLLLDEPTQALDLHQAAVIMNVLNRRAQAGLRVVAVLHDLNLAALFCPRLVLLHNGEIAADGPPADVLQTERLRWIFGDHLEVIPRPGSNLPVVLAAR